MFSRVMFAVSALALAGCATALPTGEATVFQKLASADRDAFDGLARAESDAVTGFATDHYQTGVLAPADCRDGPASKPCAITFTLSPAPPLRLEQTAPQTRALIGALADYGDRMAVLATAKDITDAQGAAAGAGSAVKALAAAAGAPAIVGVVVDAAVWAEKNALVNARRQALLQAATAADPAVGKAASRMGAIAEHLKSNLQTISASRIDQAQLDLVAARQDQAADRAQLAAMGPPKDAAAALVRSQTLAQLDRHDAAGRAAVAAMIQAGHDLQAARGLSTDFSALATAHQKLVAALKDPHPSLSEALGDLNTFLALLKQAQAATKG